MISVKKDFLKRTGELIARKRRQCGLNQRELGAYMDVAATTVSRYENGRMEIPSSNLALISSICGFSMCDYINAWNTLELKDIFKNSLELLKRGKERAHKKGGTRRMLPTYVGEENAEYHAREGVEEQIADIMASSCSATKKEDMLLIGTALECLKDRELQEKMATMVIEHYISSQQESETKKRLMAYYTAFVNGNGN